MQTPRKPGGIGLSSLLHRLFLVGLFLLGLLLLPACGDSGPVFQAETPNPSGRPDVVVVLIDTLRPDHLDLYGYERETAPFLAELAASSTVFERAYSTSSWTAPATASLFTSAYPTQHGVTKGFFATRDLQKQVAEDGSARLTINTIATDRPTMPEIFRDAGYRTFGIAANANIGDEIGFSRGFERFERLHDLRVGTAGGAADLAEQMEEWEDEIRGADPAFVYLHFNDVHNPYEENEPWYDEWSAELDSSSAEAVDSMDSMDHPKAAYDSEIRVVDASLRRIFDRFGWSAADSRTIVAVVSDHGEEFLEHGRKFHKLSLYRELVQVVSLVRAPGGEGRSVDVNVSLVDLLPTLLDLAGLPALEASAGVSLAPLVAGAEPDPSLTERLRERVLYAHRNAARQHGESEPFGPTDQQTLQSVFEGDLHLIHGAARDGDRVQLFDVARDPLESEDLSSSRPADVERLLEYLRRFEQLGRDADGDSSTEIEMNDEALEQLKTLGYVE